MYSLAPRTPPCGLLQSLLSGAPRGQPLCSPESSLSSWNGSWRPSDQPLHPPAGSAKIQGFPSLFLPSLENKQANICWALLGYRCCSRNQSSCHLLSPPRSLYMDHPSGVSQATPNPFLCP